MDFLSESHEIKKSPTDKVELFFVEIVGVEPTTPCLQSRCSSQLSYTPVFERTFSKKAVSRLLLVLGRGIEPLLQD